MTASFLKVLTCALIPCLLSSCVVRLLESEENTYTSYKKYESRFSRKTNRADPDAYKIPFKSKEIIRIRKNENEVMEFKKVEKFHLLSRYPKVTWDSTVVTEYSPNFKASEDSIDGYFRLERISDLVEDSLSRLRVYPSEGAKDQLSFHPNNTCTYRSYFGGGPDSRGTSIVLNGNYYKIGDTITTLFFYKKIDRFKYREVARPTESNYILREDTLQILYKGVVSTEQLFLKID